MKRFGLGMLFGVLLLVGMALLVLGLGLPDFGATTQAGFVERKLAPWALARSIRRHSPSLSAPILAGAVALAEGLDHYRENCLVCHAAPGVQPTEIARGLNPDAPDLTIADIQGLPDGTLLWVIQHGIRMTGMPGFGPTHSEEELRKVVAFVRHLPRLSDAEKARLRAGGEAEEQHHAH